MLIAEEPALRAIALAKYDVSDRLETCAAPRFEERVDLRPSVEHDCDAVLLEYAVRFLHRGLEPALIDIVLNRPSTAVTVVHEIGRISEDEIYAIRGHLTHHFDAVAMKDLVGEVTLLSGYYGRGCHL